MGEACEDRGTGPSTSGGTPVLVGKKCSFDAAFKLKIVACAESTTNRGAAAKCMELAEKRMTRHRGCFSCMY